MLDVDHFKKLNDNHGHAAVTSAERRRANDHSIGWRCRDCGTLRGEEFCIILPSLSVEDATAVAREFALRSVNNWRSRTR